MTDPSQSDDWAELARELERDAPPPLPTSESHPEDADEDAAGGDEFEDVETGEGGEASPPDGEPGTGDGQPGTGRKRRRRRRRRRKGGAGQAAETATPAGAETTDTDENAEPAEEEPEDEAAPVAVEDEVGGYDERDTDERDETDEEAEDAGGELLRELIATWNVPSWDEIVSGLHRPGQ